MSALSIEAQAIVDAFGRHKDVSPEQFANLRTLLENSPSLAARINVAVERGELRSIEPRSATGGAAGSYDYDNRRMGLSLAMLDTPPSPQTYSPYAAIHTIGHELGHAERGEVEQRQREDFQARIEAIAQSPGPVHDYTRPIADFVDASRNSEAHAEIAAFNAIAGALRDRHGRPGLDQIYEANPNRMQAFIDKDPNGPPHAYTMKPGFTLGADNSMASTPANVEAAAIHFYDGPAQPSPYGMGQGLDGDYRHYYAAAAIGYAAQREIENNRPREGETAPRFTVALAEVGVNEAALERNGIDLGASYRPPLAYYDSSTDPPTPGVLDHTAARAQISLEAPPLPVAPALTLRPDHPDHRPYAQIRGGIEQLDAGHGRGYDDLSERLTLTSLARWKETGGGPVDHVALSTDRSTLFLVCGPLNDPAHHRTPVAMAEAMTASLTQAQLRAETATPAVSPAPAQEPVAEQLRAPSR